MKLLPYYTSGAAGASRASIGPILENFLNIKNSRNEIYSDTVDVLERELMAHLGQDIQQQISVLTEILSVDTYPYCSNLLNTLKKRHSHAQSMEVYNNNLVDDSLLQLSAAIESKNPVALRAALNPPWYSVKFHTHSLYLKGSELLSTLS
jgi:hypothetical protein